MAQYQGVLFFQAFNAGWTEKYFMLSSSLGGAALNLSNLITARRPILHTSCEIVAATVSDVIIRGDSTNILSEAEAGTGVDTEGYMALDYAILIKWQVGIFSRNKTYLRGFGATQQSEGTTEFTIDFLADLTTYINAVIANCVFPITSRNPTPPPNYLRDSYSPATAGTPNSNLARRKTGRPFGQLRGRRVAP